MASGEAAWGSGITRSPRPAVAVQVQMIYTALSGAAGKPLPPDQRATLKRMAARRAKRGQARPAAVAAPPMVAGALNSDAKQPVGATSCYLCLTAIGIQGGEPARPCSSCEATYCQPCASRYLEVVLGGARYACSAVACAHCRARLPTDAWTPLAAAATVELFERARRELLAVQCVDCDKVHSLLLPPGQQAPPAPFAESAQAVLAGFEDDRIPVEQAAAALLQLLRPAETGGEEGGGGGVDDDAPCEGGAGCWCAGRWAVANGWLAAITDPERQLALQLALLRRSLLPLLPSNHIKPRCIWMRLAAA